MPKYFTYKPSPNSQNRNDEATYWDLPVDARSLFEPEHSRGFYVLHRSETAKVPARGKFKQIELSKVDGRAQLTLHVKLEHNQSFASATTSAELNRETNALAFNKEGVYSFLMPAEKEALPQELINLFKAIESVEILPPPIKNFIAELFGFNYQFELEKIFQAQIQTMTQNMLIGSRKKSVKPLQLSDLIKFANDVKSPKLVEILLEELSEHLSSGQAFQILKFVIALIENPIIGENYEDKKVLEQLYLRFTQQSLEQKGVKENEALLQMTLKAALKAGGAPDAIGVRRSVMCAITGLTPQEGGEFDLQIGNPTQAFNSIQCLLQLIKKQQQQIASLEQAAGNKKTESVPSPKAGSVESAERKEASEVDKEVHPLSPSMAMVASFLANTTVGPYPDPTIQLSESFTLPSSAAALSPPPFLSSSLNSASPNLSGRNTAASASDSFTPSFTSASLLTTPSSSSSNSGTPQSSASSSSTGRHGHSSSQKPRKAAGAQGTSTAAPNTAETSDRKENTDSRPS